MIFDLSGFLDGDLTVYPIEGEVEGEHLNNKSSDFTIIQPIKYKGEIYKVNGELLIHISILCKYKSQCNRCLQPTTEEVRSILSGKLVEKKGKLNEEEEFDEIIFYENGLLDLTEYVLSQAVISQPMKSLCKTDCKGLCSQCGVDLNTESCDCAGYRIDPRLEKLKDLFPKK